MLFQTTYPILGGRHVVRRVKERSLMPARLLPDKTTLRRLVDQGLTHDQIVAWVFDNTGVRVQRSTVAAALSRAGLVTPGNRYKDTLPWRVREEHLKHYAPRMLRLLGRRRAGLPLTDDQDKRLDSWLKQLNDDHSVVVYVPETDDGFFYIDGDFQEDGVPILRHLPPELR